MNENNGKAISNRSIDNKKFINRVKNYDYSQRGMYFISFKILNNKNILWLDEDEFQRMLMGKYKFPDALSLAGLMTHDAINQIKKHYQTVKVLDYVIAANHVHLLLLCIDDGYNISRVIKQLKRYISKASNISMWDKSFADRIIRNEKELYFALQYIKWNKENIFETHIKTDMDKIFNL